MKGYLLTEAESLDDIIFNCLTTDKQPKMKFSDDIQSRINTDFGKEADEAFQILMTTISQTEEINTERIIRCILFLAKGNLIELNAYIKAAKADPRDVILWAEYTVNENGEDMHMWDFSNTFENSSLMR